MPTKETVAANYARRELKSNHHPFLEEMQQLFTPEKFARVLAATKEQYGTYLPSGDVPVYDRDVLDKVDAVITQAKANYQLTDIDERNIRGAAHFAIWAHGTDTRFEKKRFRHERKDNGLPQPYAMHISRVAERLTDFDPTTIQAAFLHDVMENTLYTEENLEDIFGSVITKACRKVSKISTDSLEDLLKDLDQVELGVACDFLNQFRQDEAVDEIVTYLEDQMQKTTYYRNLTVSHFESLRPTEEHFQNKKLISEALRQYASGEDEAQMLTLMRLLSVFENEHDIRALIIKCADVADNMATIAGLAAGRGREKAESKAKIARSIFAPLARVLGLDNLALEIEDPTFFVLEPKFAGRILAKLDRLEKFDRSIERTTEKKIKQFIQDFITWANKRSGDISFSEDSIRVALRYPQASEIHRHQIALKTRLAPLVEIYIRDIFTLHAFYEFLGEVASATGEQITADNIVNVFGERVRSANFHFTAGRNNRDLQGLIYDSSGDVIDLFRPISPSWQRVNASDKYRAIFAHLRSGDYSDFLTSLQTGRVIKITLFRSGRYSHPRSLYVPETATVEDTLILAGYGNLQPTIKRNGIIVAIQNLQQGDVIELTSRTDGKSLYHPATMDRLVTSTARKRLSIYLRGILDDEHDDSRDIIRLGARYRGLRILTALSDIRAAQILYCGYNAHPYKRDFFESLLGFHRTLVEHIVGDDFLINLGTEPLIFPPDQISVSHDIYREWSELPRLGSILRRLISWVSENCYQVRSGDNLWTKDDRPANSVGVSTVFGDYLKRLDDLIRKGIVRDIIYIPVSDGQISSDYPFYIAIDPYNLSRYAGKMGISEDIALNNLFGRANKVIEKFSD